MNCRNGCPRLAIRKGMCEHCMRAYHRRSEERHRSGDGSRRHGYQLANEFHPRDRFDRETCIETLIERNIAFEEDNKGVIRWKAD